MPSPRAAAPRPLRPAVVVLSAMLLGAAAPGADLAGQSPERTLPRAGTSGLAFTLPYGADVGIGLRRLLSGDRSLGLGVNLGYGRVELERDGGTPREERTRLSVSVEPDLRFYRRRAGPVLPFVAVAARAGFEHASGGSEGWSLGTSVGMGAEWLAAERVSIAGSIGLGVNLAWSEEDDRRATSLSVGTSHSRLSLILYF
ncbi:MAG: hypothetical protein RH859_03535 [Longimicrobiales bacterium]